ncbi:helix-turn-helix domain-containing protein [Neptunomonas concharum]|uniref:helix-turn-helix domain-containing protein n=1 Tax=Neptunomonas concharum TaxID=1031538 RepID=UPI003B8361EF
MIKYSQYRKVCLGRDYLTKHYAGHFDLDEVANYACMSKYHFCRVFSEVYGESPYHYISKMRIEQAKRLLVTSKLSINDICEAVGYTSVGSFSFLFRKKTGMSPTQYRSKLWALVKDPLTYPVQSVPLCYAHHLFGEKIDKSNIE